jgi:hypothetical protein
MTPLRGSWVAHSECVERPGDISQVVLGNVLAATAKSHGCVGMHMCWEFGVTSPLPGLFQAVKMLDNQSHNIQSYQWWLQEDSSHHHVLAF